MAQWYNSRRAAYDAPCFQSRNPLRPPLLFLHRSVAIQRLHSHLGLADLRPSLRLRVVIGSRCPPQTPPAPAAQLPQLTMISLLLQLAQSYAECDAATGCCVKWALLQWAEREWRRQERRQQQQQREVGARSGKGAAVGTKDKSQ
jgi:hypothetical protein